MRFGKRTRRVRRLKASFAPLSFEQLEPRLVMAGVVINEFLAANVHSLVDEDGDRSDWIELKNTGAIAADISGWYLTDDEADLTKWQFPAVSLASGAHLIVFASAKDRSIAGQELHTNFHLDDEGEYLGLVMPDGTTIAQDFAPFPAQKDDVSYGIGANPGSTVNVDLI